MKVTIALTMLAGAAATDCSPGYTHKKILTNLKCKSGLTTATLNGDDNCNTACCEANKKTCGGLAPVCTGNTYAAKDGLKATQTQKDTWAGLAATAKTVQTDCCVKKSQCGTASYTCDSAAGLKKGTAAGKIDKAWQDTYCPTNDASCVTPCCKQAETATCEKVGAGKYKLNTGCTGGTMSGFVACGTDTACQLKWQKTAADATSATKQVAACCVIKPTCLALKSTSTCAAGKKFKTTIKVGADVTLTDTKSATFNTNCCEADTSVCGGITPAPVCASGSFKDAALNARKVTATTKDKACCSPVAKCSNYVCSSGYKAKKTAATIKCTGNVATCTDATCCDKDLTTCGGNFPTGTALTCATGFYDERTFWKTAAQVTTAAAAGKTIKATTQAVKDAWNLKNTSATTKTKECCTPVANCTNITTAVAAGITTTPAAVVTTTPAAAALKFSEHKVAIEQSSGGSNMVWLGVGAFMGMGVLMVVQHVRSLKSRRTISTDDVSLE